MSASRSAHDHEYDFLEEEKRLLDLQRGLSDDSKKWASLRKSTRALEDRSRVTRRIAFDLQDTAIADTSASTMVPPDSAKGLSTLSTGNASDSVSNMDIDLHTDINMSLGLDDLDPGLDTDFDFGLLGKSITTAADSADGHDMLSLRVDIPSNDHLVPSLDAQLDTQQTQMDWLVQIVSKGDQQIRNLEERLALQGGSS
ncbi:uncharacterized protein I303_107681 [Kwoniella dejecticola CBS 10117]|uniref:Uncharacterized protein n=1 Tax=Kwoniella dejecticola CBS 10117 TaxID=1296121 RepID=A0A1A5ZVE2_9TREE|nr:uncharacterized protein I303_07690 [Kwoniella dejecticola CBS 10117]OBR81780.1 hypothetical protein I303_07690 [Kwoniella dejecticola CBS 10117]